jgi:hypothetical protein
MQALLAALFLAAAQANAAPVAGLYEIRQMEMAGGLELTPDGHFRYSLDYGAVSEEGEGSWRADGDAIRLTSDPMPKAPTFEVVKDEPAPKGELVVKLEPPGFGTMGDHVTGLMKFKGFPEAAELDLDENGWAGFTPTVPELIIPRVPVYGDLGPTIMLSPERGHRLILRFVPNDLGKARFEGERLQREDKNLVVYRYDAKIVFHPLPR